MSICIVSSLDVKQTKQKPAFRHKFDWFVMLKSRLDAYVSRYGDFCAHNDDDQLLHLLCMRTG